MSTCRGAVVGAMAVTLSCAGVGAANGADMSSDMSSRGQAQVDQMSSQLPKVTLPAQAYDFADQHNLALPGFVEVPASRAFGEVRGQVQGATVEHLNKAGHHRDGRADGVAQEWANQAAAGKLAFKAGAADGLTHLEEGSGNVYKMTEAEARERIAWLNRDIPVHVSDPHPYGVATASDGQFVYLAEFFFN